MSKVQGKVYVIDEDESVRRSFVRLLGAANFLVETFSSVDEFIHASKGPETGCVLMDIRSADVGSEAFRESWAALKTTLPVIVVSAKDDEFTRECAREMGAVAFFRKPVDDQAILDALSWSVSGMPTKK